MSCSSFTGTNAAKLYYCIDAYPDLDVPSSQVWREIPFTGESFSASLEMTTPGRLSESDYRPDSYLSSISLQGGVSQEFSLHSSFIDLLHNALLFQLYSAHAGLTDLSSNSQRFAFLKVVEHLQTTDYYLYRGCSVSNLSVQFERGNFGQVEAGIEVYALGNPSQETPQYLSQNPASLHSDISGWSYVVATDYTPLTFTALSDFTTGYGNLLFEMTPISLAIEIARDRFDRSVLGNKAWQQAYHLGQVSAFITGTFYLPSQDFIAHADGETKFALSLTLEDDESNSISLSFPAVQVTSFEEPTISDPESDVIVSVAFSVYDDQVNDFVTVQL